MNEIEAVGVEEVELGRPDDPGPMKAERPWLFGLMIAPSAATANGVIQGGVLAYLLSQQGMGSQQYSHVIELLALPTMLYFLWSPITDFLVRRRTWLLVGGTAAGLLMGLAFWQGRLTTSRVYLLILLSACFSQLVVSSCGGMMGTLVSERSRRTSGSFYQSGSLGFGALAALVLIPISDTGHKGWLALAAVGLIALPALSALWAPHQETVSHDSFGTTMARMRREFKETFWRWDAVPYTLCMLFPMASGAAIGLITGVAKDYGVNGTQVAWMNGFGGAVLMGAGSLAAAVIPSTWRAPVVYLTLGIVNALTLGITWLGPMRPETYFVGVTLYLFTVGAAYAYFTAVLLEFLGSSGKSGSGRYSIINSLGNVPVIYMIHLDGWGGGRWGARGISATECVVSVVGASVLLAYFLFRGKRPGVVTA